MAADDVARAASAGVGEFDVAVERLHELRFHHTAKHPRWRFIGDQRKAACGTGGLQRINTGWLPFFAEDPNLFKEMVEANLIVGSRRASAGAATVDGIRKRTQHRVIWA